MTVEDCLAMARSASDAAEAASGPQARALLLCVAAAWIDLSQLVEQGSEASSALLAWIHVLVDQPIAPGDGTASRD